jgi:4'-phosphopantetheinyl transferase EntD
VKPGAATGGITSRNVTGVRLCSRPAVINRGRKVIGDRDRLIATMAATGRVPLRPLIGRDAPITPRPDRAPDLPAGTAYSVAHGAKFVVVAVGPANRVAALGADIEPLTSADRHLARSVLCDDEDGLDPLLAFTLEATYKAWNQLDGRMFEPQDVRISIDGSCCRGAVLSDDVLLCGRFVFAGDRWLALARG